MKKKTKWIMLFFTLIIAGSFYTFLTSRMNKLYADESKEKNSKKDENIIDIEKIYKDKEFGNANEDELFFLFVGVDENPKGDLHEHIRTDTMMLMNMNLKTGAINLLSIPRDTKTYIDGKLDKINHAHSYGGIDLTIKTIREMLNVDLDYFVRVDFDAVIDIVNSIGGIDYTVPKGINFTYEGVEVKEGKQTLDGIHTLMYLRHRHSYAEGDLGRVKAQQAFLKEIIKQILEKKSLGDLPTFIRTYFSKVDTNIPFNKLLSIAINADKLSADKMNTYIVPGTDGYENGVSYYFYDEVKTKDLISKLFSSYVISDYYNKEEQENK